MRGLTTAGDGLEESRKMAGKLDGEAAVPVVDGDRLVCMLICGQAAKVENCWLMLHVGLNPLPGQAEAELINTSAPSKLDLSSPSFAGESRVSGLFGCTIQHENGQMCWLAPAWLGQPPGLAALRHVMHRSRNDALNT